MRAVVLDGELVPAERAAVPIDDPGVRYGDGLWETMRAEGGTVFRLDRHLDRLSASAGALGLSGLPSRADQERAVALAVEAAPAPAHRVRLTVTSRPTLLVEAVAAQPLSPDAPTVTAASVRGAWCPGLEVAEHKTLSFAGRMAAQRRAEAVGAERALLLDADGRVGEASTANVFVVVDGAILTPPAEGLLPGLTRAIVLEVADVREAHLEEERWRAADEIFLTSAVSGVVAVSACDGRAPGRGAPGPATAEVRRAHVALVMEETGAG
jgi:branched-chain amino acid aminotransferase